MVIIWQFFFFFFCVKYRFLLSYCFLFFLLLLFWGIWKKEYIRKSLTGPISFKFSKTKWHNKKMGLLLSTGFTFGCTCAHNLAVFLWQLTVHNLRFYRHWASPGSPAAIHLSYRLTSYCWYHKHTSLIWLNLENESRHRTGSVKIINHAWWVGETNVGQIK